MRHRRRYHGDGLQLRRLDRGEPVQAAAEVVDDARRNESAELAVRDAQRVDVSGPEEGPEAGCPQGGRIEFNHVKRIVCHVGT